MSNVVPLTLENFQQVILEDSKTSLIAVVFYAEQVPESVTLLQQVEQLASQRPADFVLATVDCQTQQQIAMQFGIQGLPTLVLLKDGQPIDGVAGPQTEAALNEFMSKHLPKEEDNLLVQARELATSGDQNGAYTLMLQAHALDDSRADIKLLLADLSVELGKTEDAQALLSQIKLVDQDSDFKAVKAKLELALEAADSPEIVALEQALAAQPENLELIHKLAAQYSQAKRHEDAIVLLLNQVTRDRSDQASKTLLIDVFKALPDGDPIASQYRRKLYTLMY